MIVQITPFNNDFPTVSTINDHEIYLVGSVSTLGKSTTCSESMYCFLNLLFEAGGRGVWGCVRGCVCVCVCFVGYCQESLKATALIKCKSSNLQISYSIKVGHTR